MIDIPVEVKKVLKNDSTRKNFRVHFINSSHPDITNENIVSESVRLTESLCSEPKLKFGMCESPVLEFETYGIGKIKGFKFEASLEVDVTDALCKKKTFYADGTRQSVSIDLSTVSVGTEVLLKCNKKITFSVDAMATDESGLLTEFFFMKDDYTLSLDVQSEEVRELTELIITTKKGTVWTIEAYNTDLEYKTSEDVDFPFYSIPYGTFVVDSCKKQADMTHRQIVAYAEMAVKKWEVPEVIQNAFGNLYWNDTDIKISIDAIVQTMFKSQRQMQEKEPSRSQEITYTQTKNGITYSMTVKYKVYTLEDEKINFIEEYYKNGFAETVKTLVGFLEENELDTLLNRKSLNFYNAGQLYFETGTIKSTGEYVETYDLTMPESKVIEFDAKKGLFDFEEGKTIYIPILYKLYSDETTKKYSFYELGYGRNRTYYYPEKITLKKAESGKTTTLFDADNSTGYIMHDSVTALSSWLNYIPEMKAEKVSMIKSTGGTVKKTLYKVDFERLINEDWQKVVEAYCEANAAFGHFKRDGSFEIMPIYQNFPRPEIPGLIPIPAQEANAGKIQSSECESVWYEDDYSKYIARIICTYTNTDGETKFIEDVLGYEYDPEKERTYSITGNYLIDGHPMTEFEIRSIFSSMTRNLGGNYVKYVPMEISMRGDPSLEPGDVFELVTEEGRFVGIVERRVLSGIQNLIDSISSEDEYASETFLEGKTSYVYDEESSTLIIN